MHLTSFYKTKEIISKHLKKSILTILFLYFTYLSCNGIQLYSPTLPSESNPTHFYSTQTNSDLRITINKALSKAKHSIYISVYSLTEAKFIQTLNQKAAEGLKVTIICDPKTSGSIAKHLDPKINFSRKTNTLSLMHRKILVIDEETLYIGSSNFTYPSLEMHDNLVFGYYNPSIAQELTKTSTSKPLTFELGSIYLLPEHPQILKEILQQINQSNHSIKIAMFTWTHPKLLEAVLNAKKRGVEVEIVLDAYAAKGAGKKVYHSLIENCVKVHLPNHKELMHHKFIWIDEHSLIFGSANWTKTAFTKNEEIVFILNKCSSQENQFLKKLWRNLNQL